MMELYCSDLWNKIIENSKNTHKKWVAVAYLSSDIIKFKRNDYLIVDASSNAIKAGQTSKSLLTKYYKKGVNLFSLPFLHAKIFLFDNVLIIGSSNISKSSKDSLIEAGMISDEPKLITSAKSLITQLIPMAQKIDVNFINKIKNIKVIKKPFLKLKKKQVNIGNKTKYWIISTSPLDPDDYPDEKQDTIKGQDKAEKLKNNNNSEVTWIRYTGNSSFRRDAKPGDMLIEVYSGNKRDRTVYRDVPVIYRQEEKSCTRFYIENNDNYENDAISFGSFKKLLKKGGFLQNIGKYPVREITRKRYYGLIELWSLI